MVRHLALAFSLAVFFYLSPLAIAATGGTSSAASPVDARAESATLVNLPPDLEQLATITDLLPVMRSLYAVQMQLKSTRPAVTLEYLDSRQKLIYLRQKLLHFLDTANLEVNSSRGRIESEMAQMHELRARMVDENARTLRRNTIVNFVSGGITKIAGYSIALGGTDTPTNILEIFDGSVQCALSGFVMKQLHSESESVKGVPTLISILDQSNTIQHVYPPQVWRYLCEVPPGSTSSVSRKAQLVTGWEARGITSRTDRATKLRNGHFRSELSLARMAPQLLDDRLAMLSELRSTVSQMHHGLMQLSQISKKSYDDDPSYD